MVLITPTIILEEGSPHRGRLEISFPAYSGCETFSVPLCPSQDLLNTWPMWVQVFARDSTLIPSLSQAGES